MCSARRHRPTGWSMRRRTTASTSASAAPATTSIICIIAAEHGQQRAALHRAPPTRRSFTILAPRERDYLYHADHVGGRWVIRTNWNAPNYRLMTATRCGGVADAAAGPTWCRTMPSVFIEEFKPFDSFIAIEERAGGNKRLRLLANDGKSSFVAVGRAGLCDGARRQSRGRDDQAALHLQFADHAAR